MRDPFAGLGGGGEPVHAGVGEGGVYPPSVELDGILGAELPVLPPVYPEGLLPAVLVELEETGVHRRVEAGGQQLRLGDPVPALLLEEDLHRGPAG